MNRNSSRMFSIALILVLVMGLLSATQLAQASASLVSSPTDPIFINEIHYDNTSTDAGEAIEIFGPAGTDLTGWSLVRYNGNGGTVYTSPAANPAGADVLSGTIPDLCGGFGVVVVNYLQDGLQNGAPDGIALVNASSTVVQFLSYEGAFTGVGGPANGLISTNIGVAETGSEPLGQSLRLTGSGSLYGDFAWNSPATASFGAVNSGQTCGAGPTATPSPSPTPSSTPVVAAALVINEIDYDQPGTDTAEFIEIKNISASAVDLDSYDVLVVNGSGGGAAIATTINLPSFSLVAGDYYVVCANAATINNCDLDVTPNTDLIQNGAPDAVALVQGSTVIDTVSYEGNTGAPYTEGSGTGLEDPGTAGSTNLGISRLPDGVDTNQNNVDLSLRCITAGAANTASTSGCVLDLAPSVSNTNPTNGATNVSISGNIDITFSEDVSVSGSWFDITCGSSGTHTAMVSGGPQTFTLDPDTDFSFSESCIVRVFAAGVADQDGTPDNMTSNFVFSFTIAAQPFGVCGDPATFIHTIQGSGATSPFNNVTGIIIEGVVVGDYQDSSQFGGFHLQEEDADVDVNPATSEGIFVFSNIAVNAGDLVRVRGRVFEFSTSGVFLTEISPVTDVSVCSSGHTVTASSVTLPVSNLGDWERYEGMLINIAQNLTATENFTLGRFGEVALSVNGRLLNPTMVVAPGLPANTLQNLNDRSRILLDDGNNQQNIDPTIHPSGGLSASNTLRSGYTVNGLTGVLEQRFGVYRVQPIAPVTFNPTNPRPAAPDDVGGRLKVSAMNVLNYFTTFDTNPGSNNGPNICGPAMTLECRGANNQFEFDRQRDKIITAILGLDADIVGLMEIENNPSASVQDLVDGLNAASTPGNYNFINTGTIGTDAIKVALIYRPSKVMPVGAYAILDSTVDPTFIDTLNRPVLAQTFEENLTSARFTVAVNHLKSKGSACAGDPDTGDGQGNCNLTRLAAAIAEANWLATDPTGSGDQDILLIGDLNSYTMEDPISALLGASYTNLIDTFAESQPYSFVFQGQSGYLDHALATGTITTQATGATEWHINADEPIVLDYNEDFKTPNHVITLYADDAYRSSDHDPLIVGLNPLHYNFSGFFQPVDNAPTVNTIKAGQAIPIKFSLGGDQGLNILATGYPKIEFTACTSSTVDAVETTVSAGNSSLSYDAATDQYTYTWKTEKSWAGKCGTLSILFNDGTTQTTLFKFTK